MARATAKTAIGETAKEFLGVYREMYGEFVLAKQAGETIYGKEMPEGTTVGDLSDVELLQYCVFDLLGRERELLEACSAMNAELEVLRKRTKRTTPKKR